MSLYTAYKSACMCVINGFNLDTAGGEKLLFERKLMTSLILNGIKARTTSILFRIIFNDEWINCPSFRRGHPPSAWLWLRMRVRVPGQAGGGVPDHEARLGHLGPVQEEGAPPRHPPHHQGADGPPESGPQSPVQHQAGHDPGPQHSGTSHSLFNDHTRVRVSGHCGFPNCDPGTWWKWLLRNYAIEGGSYKIHLFQNYLNESLKCVEKTLPSGGLSIGSLDTKPIQLDSKLLLSSQLGILEKK